MSVIFNALQKVQEETALGEKSQSKKSKKIKWSMLLAFFALLIASFLLIILFFNIKQISFKKEQPKPPVLVKPAPKVKLNLTLNGVIVSKHLKIAMINNHPYHLGEHLGHLIVSKIEQDRVVLSGAEEIRILQL